MKIRYLLIGLVALFGLGVAGWRFWNGSTIQTVLNSSKTQDDAKLKEFKKLCEYYLREEFGLSKKDPFPKLDEHNTVLLSSGYDAHFSLNIPNPSGRPQPQDVACEMNEWADRFLITTYYN